MSNSAEDQNLATTEQVQAVDHEISPKVAKVAHGEVELVAGKLKAMDIGGDGVETENDSPKVETTVADNEKKKAEPPAEDSPAVLGGSADKQEKTEVDSLGEGLKATDTGLTSPVAASLREKPPGAVKTPFVDPSPASKPPPPPELNTEQQTKYNTLLESIKSLPAKGRTGPLSDDEVMWLTRENLLRYLRATKWSLADAEKRLVDTILWRRSYGFQGLTADYISPENETGKQLVLGYDVNGRPCQYLNPGLQNTEASPRQVQHLVYMVERTIDLMIPGQETLALLINFKSSGKKTNSSPPLSQGREVLNILQTHYPERMGRALIINVPWVVWGFFKLITPFIDPLTREKLKFNEKVRDYVPPEQLWKEFQGDCDFEYDHSVYWPALVQLAEERREEKKARWEKAGKHFGEHEGYLKGGDVLSAFPG